MNVRLHMPKLRLPARWSKQARTERKSARATTRPAELGGVMAAALAAAQWLLAGIVVAASLASFSESYRSQVTWAKNHALHGLWGDIFPLQVDTFILAGELAVFVAICRSWRMGARWRAWVVALGGLAASVAWNIGHVSGGTLQDRATWAVPPLAAYAALAVGLGILKRVLDSPAAAEAQPEPVPVPVVSGTELLDKLAQSVTLTVPDAPLPEKPAKPAPQQPKTPRPAARRQQQPGRTRAAAERKDGDPPVAVVRAAASAQKLAAEAGISRWRAQELMRPGSYALADDTKPVLTSVNGSAREELG